MSIIKFRSALNEAITNSQFKKRKFATLLNMSPQKFSRVLSGEVNLSLQEKKNLSIVLQKSIEELFPDEQS